MPKSAPYYSKKGLIQILFPLTFIAAGILLILFEQYQFGDLYRKLSANEWANLKSKNIATRWLKKRYTGEISIDSLVTWPIQSWPKIDSSIQFIPNAQINTWQSTQSWAESNYFGLRLRKIQESWIVTDVARQSPGYETACRPGLVLRNPSSLWKIMGNNVVGEFENQKNMGPISIAFYNPKTDTSQVIELSGNALEKTYLSNVILHKLDSNTFYIKPNKWEPKTYHGIMTSMEESGYLNNQHNNILLDLRSVGGEDIAEAAKLLSQWSNQKGELLFSIEGSRFKKMAFTSTGKTFTEWGKIVLIIDEYSGLASASIAAASMDKNNREVIVLAHPQKHRFSESINLPDGSILQLKLADVFLSDGQNPYERLSELHEIGISEKHLPGWDSIALSAAWEIYKNDQSIISGKEDIQNLLASTYPIFTEKLVQFSNGSFESHEEKVKKIWVSRAFFYWVSLHKGEQWVTENAYLYDPVIFNAYDMIKNKPSWQ